MGEASFYIEVNKINLESFLPVYIVTLFVDIQACNISLVMYQMAEFLKCSNLRYNLYDMLIPFEVRIASSQLN